MRREVEWLNFARAHLKIGHEPSKGANLARDLLSPLPEAARGLYDVHVAATARRQYNVSAHASRICAVIPGKATPLTVTFER